MAEIKEIFQPSKVYTDGIRIPFGEMFKPEFAQYEDFDLTTKRTYSNNRDYFAKENNIIAQFDQNNEIMANYMIVKYKIDKFKYATPEEFINSVVTTILKPWFVDRVNQYVSEMYDKYCEDIDKNLHNNNGTYNSSLVFTNEHSIILYRIAVLFRFISPLCTQFIKKYSDMIAAQDSTELFNDGAGRKYHSFQEAATTGRKVFTKTTFLVDVVKEVIRVVTYNNPDINIYGKLNHYTMSLIKGTGYSDQEMWNKLVMRSTSKYTITDVIVCKILIDILPKANFNKSIVKFIVTTIEQHIHWTLHQNLTISYNMISGVAEDSDFSDADRFEINSVKTNEFKKIIAGPEFMEDTINIIFSRNGFKLDPDEYNFYLNGEDTTHAIQESMIRNFFANQFGWSNLDGLSKPQYIKLMVYLLHFLKAGGKFNVLPKVFTGKIISQNEKRVLNRPVERKIKESLRYRRIMEKYSYTGSMLEQSSAIERNIVDILNASMVYNEFKGENNGEPIELDIAEVCDEYLKFIEIL